MPALIATICNAQVATLLELQTVYGLEDAYDLLEIVAVTSQNERAANEHYARRPG